MSTVSKGGGHKNIRFNSKMDEWAILTRLQDYEAEMKIKKEKEGSR